MSLFRSTALPCLALVLSLISGCGGSGTHSTPALPVAATPVFSPVAGSYSTTQSVSITDSTAAAAIYYTTDGSTPTSNSTKYTSPIPVPTSTTLKAIAVASGYTNSQVASATYTITASTTVAAPVFSEPGGNYTSAQSITITDATSGATIYYTTDGSTPTASSTAYSGAINISSGTTTLKAIAVARGVSSAVTSATYTITSSNVSYNFKTVVITGGGFVDGVFFDPAQKGLMYARTDVGGAYRWDDVPGGDSQWVPLTDFTGRTNGFNIGVSSIGIDPVDANRLYLAVGEYDQTWAPDGAILVSDNMGKTFTTVPLPFRNGSNENGRFAGERLSVDPNNDAHIYFGTRLNGLWQSNDYGSSWSQVTSFPISPPPGNTSSVTGTAADPGAGVIFEDFAPSSGTAANGNTATVYIGVSDPTTGLYVSTDGGKTFSTVPGQPTGMYPNFSALDTTNGILYITYGLDSGCTSNCTSIGPNGVTAGSVWKYTLPDSTNPKGVWTNITPPDAGDAASNYGFSSVAIDPSNPSTIMVTTLDRYYPPPGDDIFRSTDGGKTWLSIDANAVRDSSLSPWVNFGASSPGPGNWLNHIAIDPFNSNHAIYGDGQTLWQTNNLLSADGTPTSTTQVNPANATNWSIGAQGIEETVITGLISPPSGPAHLLSVMGDLGGFTHTTLTQSPPQGMDSNPILTTGTGIDFAQNVPLDIVRVGVIGYGAAQKAAGAVSTDGGLTWTPFASVPPGITLGQGSVAISADGSTIVWVPVDNGSVAYYSTNNGATWTASTGGPTENSSRTQIQVVSDRVNPKIFYLFAPNDPSSGQSTLYISTDGGHTFTVASTQNNADIALEASPVAQGDLWLTSNNGLYHSTDEGKTFSAVSGVSAAFGLGFGMPATGANYPALYMIGQVSGDSSCSQNPSDATTVPSQCIYRSTDEGKTWLHINDFAHQYGSYNIITGDPRVFGRVYLGTAGRGIIEGDPAP